jgi:hypothetical protein
MAHSKTKLLGADVLSVDYAKSGTLCANQQNLGHDQISCEFPHGIMACRMRGSVGSRESGGI